MKKLASIVTLLVMVLAITMSVGVGAATWPTKPINIIVPWGPGGASDLAARTLAVEMEKVLGQRIAITNTPGASGAIGTRAMFDAPRDGYTWSGNADGSIATYQILEYLADISHREYAAFLTLFTPNVIAVPANSPYKDFPQLLEAMKTKTITVATAGVGSGGHVAAELMKKHAGIDYKHVPYQGGAPAVTATVQGEVDMVPQLSMEVTEMLRAKQLRALVVFVSEPLVVEGYGAIQPITDWLPDFPSVGMYFGLFIPKGIPEAAMERITEAFIVASEAESTRNFIAERGSKAVSIYGKEADELMERVASQLAWLHYEAGTAKVSPEKFGIPKP